MSETPFKLSVPQEKISLLRKKLQLTTFPNELDHAGWAYGVPLADMRRLVDRWTNGYDWRYHEAQINAELPQFSRDIDLDGHGRLNIHYVHKKSGVDRAIPLLFVHGWPGHFLEVRKLLPLLTEPIDDESPAFHVVAMSIPGYGFSEGPNGKEFRLEQYAEVGNKLMLSLGYDEYVTQGGDWGFPITYRIAKMYGGSNSKAWHTNTPSGEPPGEQTEELTDREKAGLERTAWFRKTSIGYLLQQSTQPQTLGYSLADSPAGLLAWMYEKLVTWTDGYPWQDDEVLTWISIHWFSRAGPTAALRIYFETDGAGAAFAVSEPRPTIPLGLSSFPKDLLVFPRSWMESMGNVVFYNEHPDGGHLAAYERPQYLVDDLRKMFGKGGPAFGVVSGKTGYRV